MNRFTKLLIVPLLLLAATATAQTSAVVFYNPNGQTMVMVLTPAGPQVITNVQVVELVSPSPPQPAVLATSAMVLLETQEQDMELANLRVKIATDPFLQGRIVVLDKDAKDENNQPVKRVQAARQFVGNKPLPQLVGFGRDGNPVVAEALPATAPLVVDQMKKWGIK
jgi:hypothetical protein